MSENYVLKRNSLKLLSEFILERENFPIMMAYVSDVENLKVIMRALGVPAPNIQFEAFHVFKVFVANPQKAPKIAAVLTANKHKLIHFLEGFQNEKGEQLRTGTGAQACPRLCAGSLTPTLSLSHTHTHTSRVRWQRTPS
jgi:hypothetical protein